RLLAPLSALFPYTTLFRSRILISRDCESWRTGRNDERRAGSRVLFAFRQLPLFPAVETNSRFTDCRHTVLQCTRICRSSKGTSRSEEHTSELQSPCNLVCC